MVEENTDQIHQTLKELNEPHQQIIFEIDDSVDIADNTIEFPKDVLTQDSPKDDYSRYQLSKSVRHPWGNENLRKFPKRNPSYDIDMILNNDKKRKPTKGTTPPDGGWGWMIVLGSFFTYFIASGIVYSFGIFYVEFLEFYKSGKSETAWVGSLIMGIMLLVGPLASALINRYGSRVTTCLGASIAAAGFLLSIFSPNLYFLYFSFGIISGLGFGLIYLPSIVIVGQYFEKRRSFALGLSMSGSGVGVFVFSPVSKYLIDEYGWRGALLLEAGFILNCAVCGALFTPLNVSTPTVKGSLKSLLAHEDNLSNPVGDTSAIREKEEDCDAGQMKNVQYFPCEAEYQIRDGINDSNIPGLLMVPKDESTSSVCEAAAAEKDPLHNSFGLNYLVRAFKFLKQTFDFSLLKNQVFLIYVVSNVCTSIAIDAPLMFLADRALSSGIVLEKAKWIISARGISTTVGKVITGYISDFKGVKRLCFYTCVLFGMGITTALCPLCDSFLLLMFFGCLLGLFIGGYLSLTSIVLIDLVGEKMMSNGLGICLMFKGIAILVGPPLSGWFYDMTGSYDTSYIVSGTMIALSGAVLFVVPAMKRKTRSPIKP